MSKERTKIIILLEEFASSAAQIMTSLVDEDTNNTAMELAGEYSTEELKILVPLVREMLSVMEETIDQVERS